MKTFFIALLLTAGTFITGFSQNPDTTTITIKSSDLSEDMKYSFTRNDELLLLIYQFNDSNQTLENPLVIERFNFNDSIKEKTLVKLNPKLKNQKLICFLVEIDSEKTNFEIDPVIRVYHKELINCLTQRNYTCIEQYIGDEDLLGASCIKIPSSINFEGRHKLDKFKYSISFK